MDKQRLIQIDPKHPICNGWTEYELHDEFYLRMKLSPKSKPLLKLTTKGKEEIVAWTLEREGGHQGTLLRDYTGAFPPNYGIESFRKAIINGILWTANIEVPKNGANVTIDTEKDMKLSPDPRKKK